MDDEAKRIKDIGYSKRPYLIIKASGREKRMELNKSKYTLGREQSDIIIEKKSVSRKHAELAENWGGYIISDKNSNNGTFVNNKKISGGYQLQDKDIIRLGQTNDTEPELLIFCNPLSGSPGEIEETGKSGYASQSSPADGIHKEKKVIEEIKGIQAPIKQKSFLTSKPVHKIVILLFSVTMLTVFYFIVKTLILPDSYSMKILVINPRAQHPGGNIKIVGQDFYPDRAKYSIRFSDAEGTVLSVTEKEIFAQIPKNAEAGSIIPEIRYEGHLLKAPEMTVLENPTILSVKPGTLYPGDELQISGRSFSAQKDENTVLIANKEADILSSSHSQITALVPEFKELEPGSALKINIQVKSNLLISNSIEISIRKKPVEYIKHDFYAELSKDGYTLIKNSLIGLLAIDNKGSFSSIEDRTAEIIENLNLFFSRADKDSDIGYSNDAINLLSGKDIIYGIKLNAGDIQLYKNLNPDMMLDSIKLSKWTSAVLKDYLNLTVANTRPEFTVLASYGGRVLAYIYDNFNTKASDFNGITKDFIGRLDPEYRDYLKDIGIRIPVNYCDISGNYSGRAADNLLNKSISTGYLAIELNIMPSGNNIRIFHKISLEKTEDSGVFSQEATRSIGTFHLQNLEVFEPYVSFSVYLEGATVKFSGTIMDNGIQGIFTKTNKQTGKFVLKK